MKAAPEQQQTTGAGMSVGELGQYLSGYAQDLFREKAAPRPTMFERDESGKLLIPEGADAHRYQELQRAQEGEAVGKDPETGEPMRSQEWAGIKSGGFARMRDEDQKLERASAVQTRNPTDPAVREGFYEALRKRYPGRTPTPEETARAASEYLGGNERVSGASPKLIDELLNTDEQGKRKAKKKQFTSRQLDIASRKETML